MSIEFGYEETTYLTEDVLKLMDLMKLNGGRISAALELATEDNLFQSVPSDRRSIFIVEFCEKIANEEDLLACNKSFQFRQNL